MAYQEIVYACRRLGAIPEPMQNSLFVERDFFGKRFVCAHLLYGRPTQFGALFGYHDAIARLVLFTHALKFYCQH